MSDTNKMNGDGLYFLTLQVVGWVDIFTRKVYRDIIIENLQYCQAHKGLRIFAFVVMSNHLHLVVQHEAGNLGGVIRDFKSFTSKKITGYLNDSVESRRNWLKMVFEYHGKFKDHQHFQVWTHDNHPEFLFSQSFIEQKITYIHNNPVRAGFVRHPEDYVYSSASNYAGLDHVLEVECVSFKWKTI